MEKITAASLLDFLLRDRKLYAFSNKHGVSVNSFDPGRVTLGYYLQEQTDDDMREVMLWSEDMSVAEFMVQFGIAATEDLEKITQEDLWALYRADQEPTGCCGLGMPEFLADDFSEADLRKVMVHRFLSS